MWPPAAAGASSSDTVADAATDHRAVRTLLTLLVLLSWARVEGAVYPLPPAEFDLIGTTRAVAARGEDTLLDIARRHGVGQEAMLRANPGVDRWLPGEGTEVTVPSRHILPPPPREGVILNLPEMRLYYFPQPQPGETPEVQTYPVSIGRMDWSTPLGETKLVRKDENPAWYPPESIRKEHAAQGDPLPRVVPPGPDNPLGRHALRLGIPGYLIHGTNKAFGVGMRVSHGCIRMLPEDIASLYPQLPLGTPVRIVNHYVKAGWFGGDLYLEVHPPLEEDQVGREMLLETALAVIDEALFRRPAELDRFAVLRAVVEQSGLPVVISASQ
jgi:L,D-transpeptidase ErfK/SrfK